MNPEKAIKELDAAVSGETFEAELREQYPDAPEQHIENAKQLEIQKRRLKAVLEAAKRKELLREKAKMLVLKKKIDEMKRDMAAIAVQAGVATDREKQVLKDGLAQPDDPAQSDDDLATLFDPNADNPLN